MILTILYLSVSHQKENERVDDLGPCNYPNTLTDAVPKYKSIKVLQPPAHFVHLIQAIIAKHYSSVVCQASY